MQKTLLNGNPRSRPRISKLLENPQATEALRTDMTEISDSLNRLTILDDYEFGHFLDKVGTTASKFPPAYVHYKLLPELVKCLELGKGGIKALTTIIEFGKDLPEAHYQKTVTPVIVNLYASPDRVIRLQLLQSLPDYIEFLDSKTVSNKIFQHLATGFSDTEPVIREQSLKSVLHIVDKLTSKQVNGDLLRLLAKTQNDTIPEIRANTTILLGRISEKFSPSTRSGVLVAAYTRALKDPHVPSRLAALLALGASVEYFSPEECCSKLMGAVCPSLLDKDPTVRTQAASTVDTLLTKIKNRAESMNKSAVPGNESQASASTSDLTGMYYSFKAFGVPITLGISELNKSAAAEQGIDVTRAVSAPAVESQTSVNPLKARESPVTTDFNPFQPNLADDFNDDHWAPQDDEDNDGAWGSFNDDFNPSPKVSKKQPSSATKVQKTKPISASKIVLTKKVASLSLEPDAAGDDDEVDEWSNWD
ncbi:Cex1p [Sugiyamaella lignohabitans]|uniref:Cex1p n=1 Tax=Sugiyamaella lignohabitans TaxID=796027 RepID=A0A167FNA1_9ASCO|nr:Cex1p [Sugiyamaella lignohabitans]ANB15505.1 Cex1p [Sugiyamaella lignohabitans]